MVRRMLAVLKANANLFCSDKAEARRDDDARHAHYRIVDGCGCRVAGMVDRGVGMQGAM